MNDQDLLTQAFFKKLEDNPTIAELLEATIATCREGIYEKYYYAKPDVVEALLLVFRNFMEQLFEDIEVQKDISDEEGMMIVQSSLRLVDRQDHRSTTFDLSNETLFVYQHSGRSHPEVCKFY